MNQTIVFGKKYVRDSVGQVCREVEKNDSFLLLHDVSEWAVAHRVAVYLEGYFPEYNIDCEYNRMADADGTYGMRSPKRVHGTEKSRPDILVHKRGPDAEYNLLVVELKKSSSDNDNVFLDAMMIDPSFGYKHACHIVITSNGLSISWREKK